MNNYKIDIINLLKKNQNIEIISSKVEEYLIKYSGDTEILTVKAYLYLLKDNIKEGIRLLKFVIKKSPVSSDSLFLLGQAYNEIGNYYEALICLGKAIVFEDYFIKKNVNISLFFNWEICNDLINAILARLKYSMSVLPKENVVSLKEMLKEVKKNFDNKFDIFGDIIRNQKKEIIGSYLKNLKGDLYFCGIYDSFELSLYAGEYPKNLMLYKTEMLKQLYCGNGFSFKLTTESLVPVLIEQNNAIVEIQQCENKKISISISNKLHFNYFRIKEGKINIHSDKKMCIGDIISLQHKNQNKKLVISLFVDGLSQLIINKYGLENIMPYTYNFFKKGMICNNAFTSSDWTLPSLASMISGLYPENHMMIDPDVNVKYQIDQKLLFEYFKDKGYHTTIISGDWRATCATYDSIRGVDRYVAKHQNCGFRTEDVLVNALDSLEMFKDTDQYIWIGTGDLHDIADEISLPAVIQAEMELDDFQIGEKSKTSVKQKYNTNKIKNYIKAAKYIDSKLQVLYEYIENNYKDDEFVISLFGDHGQAYVVKPTEFHLSRGISNIGFMTRGGGISGVSDEYINIVDYTNIITKLAGMNDIDINSEGKLPKTYGGSTENKFAITETIHPGDPYMIAIHSKEYIFYMKSDSNVTDYGKIDMSSYNTKLLDHVGNEIFDEDIVNKLVNFVFDRIKYIIIY